MVSKTLLISLILTSLAVMPVVARQFNVVIKKLTCNNRTSHLIHYECKILKLAANRYGISGAIMLDQNIGEGSLVHVLLQVASPKHNQIVKFVNFNISLCDALTKVLGNPLLKGLMDEMRRTSNAPYNCPLKKNFLYKLTNYTVSSATFPPYTPQLNFNFSLSFYLPNEFLGSASVNGTVAPRK